MRMKLESLSQLAMRSIMRFLPAMLQFRRSNARARMPRDQDPADLGTAFGMEASLSDEMDYLPLPAAAASAEPYRQESPMSWLSRRPGAR